MQTVLRFCFERSTVCLAPHCFVDLFGFVHRQIFECPDGSEGSKPVISRCLRHVLYPPNSSAKADIPALQLRAN